MNQDNRMKGNEMAFDLNAVLNQGDFEDLGGVVKEAMEQQQEAAKQRLKSLLVNVLGEADATVRRYVVGLKTIRQQEKIAKDQLELVSESVAYLKRVGNPLPFYKVTGNLHLANQFCNTLGVPVPPADSELWTIPAAIPAAK